MEFHTNQANPHGNQSSTTISNYRNSTQALKPSHHHHHHHSSTGTQQLPPSLATNHPPPPLATGNHRNPAINTTTITPKTKINQPRKPKQFCKQPSVASIHLWCMCGMSFSLFLYLCSAAARLQLQFF